MKKTIFLAIIMVTIFTNVISAHAAILESALEFSAVFDEQGAMMSPITTVLIIAVSITIIFLLFSLVLLIRTRKKLILAKVEMESIKQLRQAFIDADDSPTYLKDENLKYVFVNKAFENFYTKCAEEVVGLDDFNIKDDDFTKMRRETDLAVLENEALIVAEEEWEGRVYKTTKFPVKMSNGRTGVGAYKRDITEERETIKKLQRMMYRHRILADVLTMSFHDMQEQLDYVLHQSLLLTESGYGYIYLYNEEKREFILNSWTNGVMKDCAVTEKKTKYQLDKTGLWGEVVRQKKPIIVNDFDQDNLLKKGYPEGHVQLKSFMSIPVIIDEKIVAVVGLANNPSGYDDNDVFEMTMLMSGVWGALERKEIQASLFIERNKYLQTLISIGDGILIVDGNGNIEMLNTIAQQLTGWTQEEALGKHYKDVFVLSSELEGVTINDPIAGVLATNMKQEMGNHAVLTAKDGTEYYLEDCAAPIKNEAGTTKGVVLVFRDVTDKKEQRKKIEYLSFHDALTGLYNRSFFEEEIQRLDTDRNLPISVIVADVNSLKLTNDVFGHSFGDDLLKKAAEVMQNSCRADDIIARWGGDEFVILLPKTGSAETEKIVARIKYEFSKEKFKAIKGSISMGIDSKQNLAEDIAHVLGRAEEKMYLAKTLEKDEVRSNAINNIISTLHENGSREKDHSIYVSEMCQKVGRKLSLEESDILKLKEAGYLHDIGKIVLDSELMSTNGQWTSLELDEIKKHATVGYRILSSFGETLDLAEYVLAHHEHWDGSGYPKGLEGEQIPLISRVISIVETYERVLERGDLPFEERKRTAIEVINKGAGSQFDPNIAEIFIQTVDNKMDEMSKEWIN